MSSQNIIEIKSVDRTYVDANKNVVNALKGINLSVVEGEFLSIIGPSGCGKTTLLRLIAGLDTPQSGAVTFEGKAVNAPGPDRGYVFQNGGLFPWLTIEKNIATGLKARDVYRAEKDKVAEYISLVGLSGFEKAYPHQISGGMAQRASLARALINHPKALLLDEPLGALDAFTRIGLQDKILELWNSRGTTMVLVTHDVDEAIYLSDRVVIMTPRPGKIEEIIDVQLKRPRDRSTEEFIALRVEILRKLHLASNPVSPEFNI